jgi:osmoprotectant transport system substrate-binding protein
MRRTPTRVLLAILLALSAVAAACGDSGSTSSTGNAPNTGGNTTSGGNGGVLQFKPLDAGGPLTKAALKQNQIQVAVLFTSDADIAVEKWVLLEDDKNLQPAENVIPAIRKSATSPAIEKALNTVSKPLTTAELTELNRQQSQDKQDSDKIAKAWLEKQKLVPYAGDKVSGTIKVGSTNFGEQEIVAEIYSQVLESAGAKVDRKFKLGNREVVEPALEKGDIDLYPEYVGSYTAFLDKNAPQLTDVAKAVDQLKKLADTKGIVLAEAAPAEDKNGFVVTKATSDKYKLHNVSDLKNVPDTLVLGGPPECPQRPFCVLGLQQTYGLTVKV